MFVTALSLSPHTLGHSQGLHLMRFLGINVETVSPSRAEKIIVDHLEGEAVGAVVIHANLNTAHSSLRDERLRAALEAPGSLVLFEGIGLKVARWLTSGEWWPDANGTDLVPSVLESLAHRPVKVALVGGHDGVAAAAGEQMKKRFRNLQVVGAWNGYEDRNNEAALLRAITDSKPDIVLLGLGTPIQEPLAVALANPTGAKVIWAVGGLLDYMAGVRRRAPFVVRMVRLEWLWRLALYPRSYARRYIVQAVWLLWQVLMIWTERRAPGPNRSAANPVTHLRQPVDGRSD